MKIQFILAISLMLLWNTAMGQVVINEVVSLNNNGPCDNDGDCADWIELYNASNDTINLKAYTITDKWNDSLAWEFPDIAIAPKSFLFLFASGKDRKIVSQHYQTVIKEGDSWQYLIPPYEEDENWRLPEYNASHWKSGSSGFGYGDGDDNTYIQPLQSIFIRKEFSIDDLNALNKLILHVDFDDGFAAFINGQLVASENVNIPRENYNDASIDGLHEAQMYQGGLPEKYEINTEEVTLFPGENILALQGYNISQTSSDFTLIPFLTLGSQDYTVNKVVDFFEIDGKDDLHTNFKIKSGGESLYLFDSLNQLVDSLTVPALEQNASYGRYPDGSADLAYFLSPTPGEANNNPFSEIRKDTVHFSVPGGIFAEPFSLGLQGSAEGVKIYYTTNCSEPDTTDNLYIKPMSISQTSVIKAATWVDGMKTSQTHTSSYIFSSDIDLPLVSLSTDSVHLFDYYQGILELGPNAETNNPHFGANFWQDWEKPINFEYFDESGQQQVNQLVGTKVYGSWSKAFPQKSLALYARSIYGKGSLKYKFFQDKEIDQFESIVMRNSGNDFPHTTMRDGLTSEIVKKTDSDRQAFQPCVVYINGAYWGVMNMREKINEHFLKSNQGIEPEDLILIDNNRNATHGDKQDYNKLVSQFESEDIQSDATYKKIVSQIDLSNYIDYHLTQIYINNTDWPGNNFKLWKSYKPHSKWRWIVFDTDFGYGLYDAVGYRNNTLAFATTPNLSSWPNPDWSTLFLRKLVVNEEFKVLFINRFADLMNTEFKEEHLIQKADSIADLIGPEMTSHTLRWNRTYKSWEIKIYELKSFITKRDNYIWDHFENFFGLEGRHQLHISVGDPSKGGVQVNSIRPKSYPFTGTYFDGIPLKIKAIPKLGYRFVRWELDADTTKTAIEVIMDGDLHLSAVFEADVEHDYQIVINEINYTSSEAYNAGDWIELYNNGQQTVDLSYWQLSDSNSDTTFIFPEGSIIHPDDYLIVCDDVGDFSEVYPTVKSVLGDLPFGLSSSGDLIRLSDANAGIIDELWYETALPWPSEPLNGNVTLELNNPDYDNSTGANWTAGNDGGSPGRQNDAMIPTLKIAHAQYFSATCMPNAFSDFTTLRFYSPGSGEVKVQIFDMQGRIVQSINETILSAGTQYLDIFMDQEKFKKGIYFVKVQTALNTETIKVIKL